MGSVGAARWFHSSSTSRVTPASEVAQIGPCGLALRSRAGRPPISRLHYNSGNLQGAGLVAGNVPEGSGVIVRHLLQPEAIGSRRALLGGLAGFGGVLALGGCADLGATAPRFDASALSVDPTLLVATTRKPVNGGREKPWFGPERASTMIVARAKLVPPGDSRLSLA